MTFEVKAENTAEMVLVSVELLNMQADRIAALEARLLEISTAVGEALNGANYDGPSSRSPIDVLAWFKAENMRKREWIDEYHRTVQTQAAENAKLRERIGALEGWLKTYLPHDEQCTASRSGKCVTSDSPCDCGLAAILTEER